MLIGELRLGEGGGVSALPFYAPRQHLMSKLATAQVFGLSSPGFTASNGDISAERRK